MDDVSGGERSPSTLRVRRSGRQREGSSGPAHQNVDGGGLDTSPTSRYPRVRQTVKSQTRKFEKRPPKKQTFSFDKFNAEQLEVVKHGTDPLVIYSAAGSGKTRSIIGRIVRLVNDGVGESTILATTFTKKAAEEMTNRLENEGVTGVNVCTMHSFCWDILRKYGPFAEWTVDDKNEYETILKNTISYKNMNWKGCDLSKLQQFISLAKNSLVRPEEAQFWDEFRNDPFYGDQRYIQAYFFAEETRQTKKLITFDDMLIGGVELLRNNTTARDKIQTQYEWVIVDEAQDSNLAQIALTEIVAAPQWNVTIVGDIDQCQPAGTIISKANRGQKPIEEILPGEHVLVWDRLAGNIAGMRKVTRVGSRNYSGLLYAIRVGENITRMTEDHRLSVKLDYDVDCWVVYLMYRADLGYRVGWCKFFSDHRGQKRNWHFAKRARLERADCAWVLKAFDDPQEATLYESVVATKHGLPLIPFEPSTRAVHYTRSGIKWCFQQLDDENEFRAKAALEAHRRLFSFPLYRKDLISRAGGMALVETVAANLIQNVMMLPSSDGWSTISQIVTTNVYELQVYSLEIEDKHNYIADGIGVNNCIYEWRGSRPKYFLDFPKRAQELSGKETKTVILPMNYRSREEIIRRAALCIKNNKDRVEIPFTAFKKEPATILYTRAADQDDEAEIVLTQVKTLLAADYKPGDIKILARTNAQSRAPEEVFCREKIPHVVLGGGSFYQRSEVKSLLAYLDLIADPCNYDAGIKTLTKPFRYIGQDAIQEIMKERGAENPFILATEYVATKSKYGRQLNAYVRDMRGFIEWYELVKKVDKHYPTTGELLSKIVQETKFVDFVASAEGGDTMENSRAANIGELIRSASRYRSIPDFLQFVAWQIEQRKKNKERKNAVQISTIHKQKGLESRAVFVIGVNDGILPHAAGEVQEERRLYYVAITRAEEYLHLSSVASLGLGNKILAPSPFLFESEMIAIDDSSEI